MAREKQKEVRQERSTQYKVILPFASGFPLTAEINVSDKGGDGTPPNTTHLTFWILNRNRDVAYRSHDISIASIKGLSLPVLDIPGPKPPRFPRFQMQITRFK